MDSHGSKPLAGKILLWFGPRHSQSGRRLPVLVLALLFATLAGVAAWWLGTQPAAAQTTQSALSALSLTDITLSPTFEAGTTYYVGTAAAGATRTTVSAAVESGTTATISPADADDQADGHQVDISHGTEITITTSATNQLDTTYSVVVSLGAAAVESVAITSDPGIDATYAVNDVITVAATFDRPVFVDATHATPYLTITVENNDRNATYSSIAAKDRILIFSYTVVAEDDDQDGISIDANSLSLNGGTIKDQTTGENAQVTHDAVAVQAGHLVNKIPNIVTGGVVITSAPLATSDTYGAGETVSFTITFDSVVVVDTSGGAPALRMRFWHPGGRTQDKDSTYVGGSGTDTLAFEYVVQPNDRDRTGLAVSANQLRLHGGTIKHYTTNRDANLRHAAPSIGSGHKVDGSLVPPSAALSALSLTGVTLSPAFAAATTQYEGTVAVGTTQTTVSATAEAGTTVSISPADADDLATGHQVDLATGANTIAVTASRSDALPRTYTLIVNRLWAEIGSVAISSDPGTDATYAVGDSITVAVTFNNSISVDTVDGTPYLTIRSGSKNRNAGYSSIDATNRILTFSYTVVAEDNDQSGISIQSNALSLNGGSIKDMATEQDAVLDHDALDDQPLHRVNKFPRIVSGGVVITSAPLATSDTYGAGETVSFTITFDSVVVVDTSGGAPALRMRFWHPGGRTQDKDSTYVGGSGTDTLAFEYVVQPNDRDRTGLAVSANQLRLHGGTIKHYTTNRDANLRHAAPSIGSGHKVDGSLVPPSAALSALSLTGVTLSPAFAAATTQYEGTVAVGTTQTTVSATAEAGTTVSISPADADDLATGHQVDLATGAVVTISASASDKLATTYTVALSFLPAAVQSVAISSDPGTDATYAESDVITVTATFDKPASVDTIGGTPTIIINVGNNGRDIDYTSIDSTNRILTFSYTVVAGDSDQDGVSINADSISLGGGTIKDQVTDENADITHDALADQSGHLVNKIPTIVSGGVAITSTPHATSDTYGFEETISVVVTFDSNVVVDTTDGTPTVTMEFSKDGVAAGTRNLSYASGTGTTTLVFEYVVRANDIDDDGLAMDADQLTLNGGTIKHSTTGKDANLDHARPETDGVFSDHKIDGAQGAPGAKLSTMSLTDITLSPTFEAGTTDYVGTAAAGTTRTTVSAAVESGTTATISPADADDQTDEHQVDISHGVEITIAASATNQLDTTYSVVVSLGAAAVQSVAISSDPGTDATYAQGDVVTVAATFDHPASVETAGGTPYIQISVGGNDRNADYTSIDATNRILTFAYTVVAGDSDQDGVSIGANAVSLNGGTIKDQATGENAQITHNAVADQSSHLVNKIPNIVPGGVEVMSTPQATSNTYGFEETVSVAVTFDSKVVVDTTNGTPTVTMAFSQGGVGAGSRNLSYTSGTGTATLVFEYVVRIEDADDDGLVIIANKLALKGGDIEHSTTGQDANLDHATPGSDGVFSDHKIDGTLGAPRATLSTLSLTDITLSPAFEAGTTSYIGTATPGTALTTVSASAETGTTVRISPADAQDGTAGHQQDIRHGTRITISASAAGHVTNAYTVTVYFTAEVQSVAFSSDPGADATYATGDVVSLGFRFDKPVSVDTTGGTPYVTISVGSNDRNAAYSSIDASNRILTFSYTAVAGDDDQDGISIDANSLSLNGGTITDIGNNQAAVLGHNALVDQAGHLVNKIPNIVTGGVVITSTPLAAAETYGAGEVISFSVTFDSVVNVDTTGGTPTLRMRLWHPGIQGRDRDMAYASGSGTDTLVFEYVVQGEDLDNTGIVVSRNQIRLEGGTIKHASTGRNANLNHGKRTPSRHKVDGSIQLAALTALSLDDGALSPAFITGITSYTAAVGRGITQTTVTASAATGTTVSITPADASVGTIGHQVDLSRGANTITVTVSKTGLITRTYTVTVNRLWAEIENIAITSNPGWDDTYTTGDEIEVSVTFNGPVSVDTTNGTPHVVVLVGSYYRPAAFASIDSTNRVLTFTYTVESFDGSIGGLALEEDSLMLNGGGIKHLITNQDALISHGGLASNPRHQVNKKPRIVPRGVKIASNPVAGEDTYSVGEIIRFRVTFDSLVVVNTDNGTPSLLVSFADDDNPARNVRFYYSAGSGSTRLDFEYEVRLEDRDSNGVWVGTNKLRLNGGTIRHMTTHRDAVLQHSSNPRYSRHKVDPTVAPTLLFSCGLRVLDKNSELDLCMQMPTPVPTDQDVVFEWRRKPYYGVPFKNIGTEDFDDWIEFARGGRHTSCGATCIRFTLTLNSGRGAGTTYQARARQGETILATSRRLEVHHPNLSDAELNTELSGVFYPHDFTSYPGDVATGIFRTDLTFTDPVVRATAVELVEGLQASDFHVNNGRVANIVPDPGASYVITIVPTTLGDPVIISLPQGTVFGVGPAFNADGTNAFTRPNNASNILTVQTAIP